MTNQHRQRPVAPGLAPLFRMAGLSLLCASVTMAQQSGQIEGDEGAATVQSELSLLGETIVIATRSSGPSMDRPFSADTISSSQIERRGYRTTPQILRDTPGVMVQETAQGQGSPYIRGFTGYRNLFLIDGIRLNNSVFRSGPNQYWNTVDPLLIDRLEVIKGPSSVLFGSDAIGGTVNVITKNPTGYGPGLRFAGELIYRYSSAEHSNLGRAEFRATEGESLGVLAAVGGKYFGDLRGGRDIGRQPNTGYDEFDADIKIERFLDSDSRLVFAHQRVRQDDVPRTHKTVSAKSFKGTTVGSDLARDLNQERELTYLQLSGENQGAFVDSYRMSLSWHEQEELRNRVKGNGNAERQGIDVGTLGFFAHFTSNSALGRLNWGVDYYRDKVDSFKDGQPIQGPVADDASYDLLGVFIQDEIDVAKKLTLTLGGRFNYAAADADSVLDPVSAGKIAIDESWSSVAGSLRFLYRLDGGTTNLFGGLSQGFRAPNLSDLSRFDSARTNEFEVPAPGLDPEKYLSYELGIKSQGERQSSQVSLFYTDIEDQIALFPTGMTNASGEFEITKDNIGDGYVWGIEVGGAFKLSPQWTAFGNATYLEGKVDTFPTSAQVKTEEYISRLMPLTAQLGARWESSAEDRWAEVVTVYADDADRLSTRDRADTSRIPPGGTPGYLLFHLRGGWQVSETVTVNLALENIGNEDYRIHGSGQNMPGRNLIVGVSVLL